MKPVSYEIAIERTAGAGWMAVAFLLGHVAPLWVVLAFAAGSAVNAAIHWRLAYLLNAEVED